jgi:hypothetical protein
MNTILDVELQTLESSYPFIMPISIHSHTACNLVIWKAMITSDQEADWSEIKRTVARLMDRLADLLHDYQKFAPLVALIELQAQSDVWSTLMGDQDWHRGRFVMQAVKTYKGQTVEESKKRWLGPLRKGSYEPRRITDEDFSTLLKETLKLSTPPKGADVRLFSRYSDNLITAVNKGNASEMAFSWRNELLNDVNNLLGRDILEDVSFGQ